MSEWAPTVDTPENWAVLDHLRKTGTLALVDKLYDEDAAGIVRDSVSVEDFIAMLSDECRAGNLHECVQFPCGCPCHRQ